MGLENREAADLIAPLVARQIRSAVADARGRGIEVGEVTEFALTLGGQSYAFDLALSAGSFVGAINGKPVVTGFVDANGAQNSASSGSAAAVWAVNASFAAEAAQAAAEAAAQTATNDQVTRGDLARGSAITTSFATAAAKAAALRARDEPRDET